MTHTADTRQLNRINRIIRPWLPLTTERRPWTVTLRTGTQVTIHCPLGAAVEVEEAGHRIELQPTR